MRTCSVNDKLHGLFSPESIAIIGASNSFGKLGYHVMKSLVGNYRGRIFPVNPKGERIWGLDCWPSLAAIPEIIDLAIIVVPAPFVPETLHECGRKPVKGVVLITAGFREIEDAEGGFLEDEVRRIARLYDLPIVGPNTFGFVNLDAGVNASFTSEFSLIEKGGVALISQSGGICHLCGFLAIEQRVGLSTLMSLGNRCSFDFPEALTYFVEQEEATRVLALYIEGLDRPKELIETAQSLRGKKPIIALKAGKSEKGDSASRFHTGSLAGNHQIWKGALHQAGILEVDSAEELIDTAKTLDSCPAPDGPRIAVLSGQAGPGMIAADALNPAGLELATFTARTQEAINRLLPPIAIRTNPVDMGPAWYSPKDMLDILHTAIADDATDGVIFLAMYASANLRLAEELEKYMQKTGVFGKPVIACFTAPPGVWDHAIQGLDRRKGMAILSTPERAVKAMGNLWKMRLLSGRKD
jgi:acyl-CoA synthetase (NDP forming)